MIIIQSNTYLFLTCIQLNFFFYFILEGCLKPQIQLKAKKLIQNFKMKIEFCRKFFMQLAIHEL